jgi:hypothetical protein
MPGNPTHADDPACDDLLGSVGGADFLASLHRATDGLKPSDARALVAGGYARGRRVHRRRTVMTAAAAAVLALTGVGGALVAVSGHGEVRGGAAAGVTATPCLGGSLPSPSSPSSPAVVVEVPVTAQDMDTLLTGMLPRGSVSDRAGTGTDSGLPASAHLVFDDGRGRSAIEVDVTGSDDGGSAPATVAGADSSCSTRVDGGILNFQQGHEHPDRRADTELWLASFRRTDGVTVTVREWNAPAEKDAQVTRPEPPLNEGQLVAIVTNGAWRHVAAAIPSRATPRTPRP